MCYLMTEPEGNQLRIEPKALGFRVRHTREMLEAHESDSLSIYYQLTGVRGADSYHQIDVDIAVDVEQRPALLLGIPRQRHDIDPFEHGAEVDPTRKRRRANDFHEVWP